MGQSEILYSLRASKAFILLYFTRETTSLTINRSCGVQKPHFDDLDALTCTCICALQRTVKVSIGDHKKFMHLIMDGSMKRWAMPVIK